ncbi:MAG TPA: rhomboid family intramembrane serine protease [Labilithrix sp.]|nr:rhomboid family intramembrane serine protease [Labilithrix sp.]
MNDADDARIRIAPDDSTSGAPAPEPEDARAARIRVADRIFASAEQPVRVDAHPRTPPITGALLVVCVAITALLNLAPNVPAHDWLVPTSSQIWTQFRVWGLLTSALVHVQIVHLLFNLWWARDFGRLLEPEFGRLRWIGFIAAAAIVSSSFELLVADTLGIGFSGVVYALFGYVLVRRRSVPAYAALLTRKTVQWMLGWLVLCIVLTHTKVMNIANAAHFAGLAFGSLLGVAVEYPRRRGLAIAGVAALGVGVILSVVYMPWSARWRARDWLATAESDIKSSAAGNSEAQARTGAWYVTSPERRAEGIAMLRSSAEAGSVTGMNHLAWVLATCTEPNVRNGVDAVRWAEKATAQTPSAPFVDTLAAAYAEAGRWDEALVAQRRALDLLGPDAPAEQRKSLEEHLALIEKHEPIRE